MAARGFIELLRLADLAKARQTGRNNPNQAQWLGVVFESAGQKMVAPLGEVSEVLAMPELTPIPLTKSWLLGVANVRGRLLPLTDLAKFLGLEGGERLKSRKVMVVDQGETFSGILVDQVLGISQFTSTQYVAEAMPITSPFARFSHGKFKKDGDEWHVFMPSLLVQDTQYDNAALE
ncbi:MAG: chemotaxis protein CheW [Moraxella sp.]|nr:chemotaxis protein CheW [Moraxella sp.]